MTKGEVSDAERRALNILDQWLNVTGAVSRGCSWHYELQAVICDAVHCGIQGATKDFNRLDGEEGPVPGLSETEFGSDK